MITPKNEKNTAYTLFPIELLETLKETFDEGFEVQAKKGEFVSFGHIYQGEIVLRIGYLKKNSIAQTNFDTSIEASGSQASIVSAVENLVFSTKELFVDYFKNQNLEQFSYHWNEFNSSSKVFYKLDATNTSLESQADVLLGEDPEALFDEGLIMGDMSGSSDEIEKIVGTLQNSHFTFK